MSVHISSISIEKFTVFYGVHENIWLYNIIRRHAVIAVAIVQNCRIEDSEGDNSIEL